MCFFFFKQKTAYELRISDWSSDVCSSDLEPKVDKPVRTIIARVRQSARRGSGKCGESCSSKGHGYLGGVSDCFRRGAMHARAARRLSCARIIGTGISMRGAHACRQGYPWPSLSSDPLRPRSEEHTSELQSLMRISY